MADEISEKIANGWDLHRKGENTSAARVFEDVLAIDASNVDGYYGLGLALRASGNTAAAKDAFSRAKTLAEKYLAENTDGDNTNNLKTSQDDRYLMLSRMLQQRISES